MALSLVTPPESDPVSLDEAKDHLRVEVDDENALIVGLITAATHYVEAFTKRALLTQAWTLTLDDFWCHEYAQDGAIWLPFPPVQSVDSITYVDTAGVTQTWSSANYTTDLPSGPHARRARLAPAYQVITPVTRAVLNAVTIAFTCGYGDDPDDVPDGLRAAIKVLVSHWYVRREPVNVGNIVTPIPMTVDALLWPFRAF